MTSETECCLSVLQDQEVQASAVILQTHKGLVAQQTAMTATTLKAAPRVRQPQHKGDQLSMAVVIVSLHQPSGCSRIVYHPENTQNTAVEYCEEYYNSVRCCRYPDGEATDAAKQSK